MSKAVGLIEALRRRAEAVAGHDWETATLLAEAADELAAFTAAGGGYRSGWFGVNGDPRAPAHP